MTALKQHYRAAQKQGVMWDSFTWWAGLAVAVLAVPSIAIIFATIMPFRSDVAESIIFILLCWTCTYLGMHLMKFYGLDGILGRSEEHAKETAQRDTALLSTYTISPAPEAKKVGYIIDRRNKGERRRRQSDRRGDTVKAMFYSGAVSPSSKEHYNS